MSLGWPSMWHSCCKHIKIQNYATERSKGSILCRNATLCIHCFLQIKITDKPLEWINDATEIDVSNLLPHVW